MKTINLKEFKKLIDIKLFDDCLIDELGIRAKSSEDNSLDRMLFEQMMSLVFPCTDLQLISWLQVIDTWELNHLEEHNQRHLITQLPSEFFNQWQKYSKENLDNWNFDSHSMLAFLKAKGFAMSNVDWSHYLTLSEWTKEQAVLLLCNLDPIAFQKVKRFENYDELCQPLIKLQERLPPLQSQTPIIWLRWFDENGYLCGAPKKIAEFYATKQNNNTDSGVINRSKHNQRADKKNQALKVSQVFSSFQNLRSIDISLVVNENKTVIAVVKGKRITITPVDLGLSVNSKEWNLFEVAAINSGDFNNAFKSLKYSSDRELRAANIKTDISRLRNKLRESIGLINDPIVYLKGCGYKFNFKSVTHGLLGGSTVTKSSDAMEYTQREGFDYLSDEGESDYGNENSDGFWKENENY